MSDFSNSFWEKLRTIVKETIKDEIINLQTSVPTNPEVDVGFMSRRETAELLRISLPTLHKRTLMKQYPCYKDGDRVLYKRDEILACVAKKKR